MIDIDEACKVRFEAYEGESYGPGTVYWRSLRHTSSKVPDYVINPVSCSVPTICSLLILQVSLGFTVLHKPPRSVGPLVCLYCVPEARR